MTQVRSMGTYSDSKKETKPPRHLPVDAPSATQRHALLSIISTCW